MTTDRITCPFCERSIDVDQIENADLYRERADLAAKLGHVCWIANEYVDCFRRKPGGRISLKRRTRILREIVKLWETGVFEINGKRYRATQPVIVQGLQAVCNRELTGLENHNYLKKVLLEGAERISAKGETAREEEAREQRRVFEAGSGRTDDVLGSEENARRARLMVDRIGSKA